MDGPSDSHKTPQKFLENIRDVVRGKVQASPFRCLPHHTTPPSRFLKIKNPFEAALNERLHAHIFSPSVFAKVDNCKNQEKFMWTIEDVSSLHPAHIDESTIAQFEQSNPEDEIIVQQKIEKYFSATQIVPSPWNEVKTIPLISESSPVTIEVKDTCDSWSQTTLSLPPNLPDELEQALKPFFSFTQSQKRDTVDVSGPMYKKLFAFDHELIVSPESSARSELSDAPVSPILESNGNKSNFSPDTLLTHPINSTPKKLNDCEISPIFNSVKLRGDDSFGARPLSTSVKSLSRSRLKFDNGNMSVDTSYNMVPENDRINCSIDSESPLRGHDFMETSFDWDIEYNNVSFNKPQCQLLVDNAELMDISNVATPKLRSKTSQGKNLSNSFKTESSDEMSQDEGRKFRKVNLFENEYQDTGYNTMTSSKGDFSDDLKDTNELGWNLNIFMSTPQ